MRIIKFRGKGKKDSKWYFGNLYDIDVFGRTHICATNEGCFDIDTDIICQFTGLYDKNYKRIYECDILRLNGYADITFTFMQGTFGYIYRNDFHPFDGNTDFTVYSKNTYEDVEIIGNIFDNPELLKGGEK